MKSIAKFIPLLLVTSFTLNTVAFGMSSDGFVPLKKPAGPCVICLSLETDTSDIQLTKEVPVWTTGRCGHKCHTHCLLRLQGLRSRSESPLSGCPCCGDVAAMEDVFCNFYRLTPSPIAVSDGLTDLVLATKSNSPGVVADLISAAKRRLSHKLFTRFINAKTIKGQTALHYAVMNNNFEIAKLLVGAGANVTIKNNHGWNACDIAKKNSNIAMIELFFPRPGRTLLYSPITPAK